MTAANRVVKWAMQVINRAGPLSVALETTLLVHGVPKGEGAKLAAHLRADIESRGASAAVVGVIAGMPTVGLTDPELAALLAAPSVPKANTGNLGVLIHRRSHAATTVSTTMELAAAAGVRVFATGGLGGLHKGFAERPDISADLAAFTRFPVATVCSGVKSLLDVVGTRELLETLGVCVVGWRTDQFPAFYQRESGAKVDARFDDASELAAFVGAELSRTGRGIVVCNPVSGEHEIERGVFEAWLREAEREAATSAGRDVTPAVLGALHRLSGGATLRTNIALVRENARVAAMLRRLMPD